MQGMWSNLSGKN